MSAPAPEIDAYLTETITRLRDALVRKHGPGGFPSAIVSFGLPSGWSITCYGPRHEYRDFRALTFAEAVASAESWIARDDVALGNLTLGLTADGRFAQPEREREAA